MKHQRDKLQAIPTSYNGTEFRSKSEAIFALALDLCHIKNLEWEYEPRLINGIFINDWYRPDFLVRFDKGLKVLIEYKPAKPVQEYVDKLWRWHRQNKITVPLAIAYGSAFNQSTRGSHLYPDDLSTAWQNCAVWYAILKPALMNLDKARSHRFDLVQSRRR